MKDKKLTRREFLEKFAGVSSGVFFLGVNLLAYEKSCWGEEAITIKIKQMPMTRLVYGPQARQAPEPPEQSEDIQTDENSETRIFTEEDLESKHGSDVILKEREQKNLAAVSKIGNCLILDYYVNANGSVNMHKAQSDEKIERFSDELSRKYYQLILNTVNTRGYLDNGLIAEWDQFYKANLSDFARRQTSHLSINRQASITVKPLLIIKSNENNSNLPMLQSVSALRDHFILFISTLCPNGNETPPLDLINKINAVPVLRRNNAVFIIRPPKGGVSSEQKRKWSELINELRDLMGEENVVFNPDRNMFVGALRDKGKEVVVVEITHTDEGIVLKNEDIFKIVDVEVLNDLSHIKYMLAGNSCSLPKIDNGKLLAAFKDRGVGLINASFSRISMDSVLKRMELIIQVLKNPHLFNLPAFYISDIIDQSNQIKEGERGTTNLGQLAPEIRDFVLSMV